jgi:hypothetical protein
MIIRVLTLTLISMIMHDNSTIIAFFLASTIKTIRKENSCEY